MEVLHVCRIEGGSQVLKAERGSENHSNILKSVLVTILLVAIPSLSSRFGVNSTAAGGVTGSTHVRSRTYAPRPTSSSRAVASPSSSTVAFGTGAPTTHAPFGRTRPTGERRSPETENAILLAPRVSRRPGGASCASGSTSRLTWRATSWRQRSPRTLASIASCELQGCWPRTRGWVQAVR